MVLSYTHSFEAIIYSPPKSWLLRGKFRKKNSSIQNKKSGQYYGGGGGENIFVRHTDLDSHEL